MPQICVRHTYLQIQIRGTFCVLSGNSIVGGLSQNLDTNSGQQPHQILHSAVFYLVTHS